MTTHDHLCMCRWRVGERLRDKLNAIEDDAIDRALAMCRGNRTGAARLLNMSARTLSYILAERRGLVKYKRKRSRPNARPQ